MATSGALADFGRMPTQRKVLVFVVIGLLLGLLYWRFAYQSLSEKVSKAEQQVKQNAQKNAKLEKDLTAYNELRSNKELLDRTMIEQQRALPSRSEIPVFFETIERKLTEAGIDDMKYQNRPEQPFDQFIKVPFDVQITGTFLQIKKFFASLVPPKPQPGTPPPEQERIMSIENLSIGDATLRNREIVLTAKFTAVTYRQAENDDPKPGKPGELPANAPAPAPAAGAAPPLPSAGTPAGARARVEDALDKDAQRVEDKTADPGAGSGSARLKGGL